VRHGEFEGIRDTIATDPARAPDFGELKVHPTAGAVAIGARPVLIAYNVELATPDVAVAKRIAKKVRARDGGLPEVKALGFELADRHRAQVSMNLTDYRVTPVHRAFDAVRGAAEEEGTRAEESEVVGLVPEDALFDAAEHYLLLKGFERRAILERRVRAAEADRPGHEPIGEFLGRLAARTPTPGGGSAAAVAAALASALGEMVIAYSSKGPPTDPDVAAAGAALGAGRRRFLALCDDDSAAYEAVRSAARARKERPGDAATEAAYVAALRRAAEVPLETARAASDLSSRLSGVGPRTKAALASDLLTAQALFRAAIEGALANVTVNLESLRAAGAPGSEVLAEVERLRP
jgi:glutamate formiminotransferase / formiminotetrahydrofolate cyclodeaminase